VLPDLADGGIVAGEFGFSRRIGAAAGRNAAQTGEQRT
jgi:hypothetical protein